MAESIQSGLVQATQVAREAAVRRAANGVRFAAFGEIGLDDGELGANRARRCRRRWRRRWDARRTTLCRWRWPRDAAAESAGHRSGNGPR